MQVSIHSKITERQMIEHTKKLAEEATAVAEQAIAAPLYRGHRSRITVGG